MSEKIEAYLGTLPEKVLLRLLYEIRSSELLGMHDDASTMIADAAMHVLSARHPDRADALSPPTALFAPVLPFIVATERGTKFSGRVRERSLQYLWIYLARDCAVGDLTNLASDAGLSMLAANGSAHSAFEAVQSDVVPELRKLLGQLGPENMTRARLIAQIGGNAVAEDLGDICVILEKHAVLSAMQSRLPEDIHVLNRDHVSVIEGALAAFEPGEYAIPITLLMTHLNCPTTMLRILLDEEGTDDASVLAKSKYAAIVDVLLNELSVLTDQIAEHVNVPGRSQQIISCLRQFRSIGAGLTTEISIELHSAWLQRLAAARRRIADIAAREIEQIPARLRLAIQPGGGSLAPDPKDIDAAVSAARLMVAIKPLRSELALNEIVTRVSNQVDSLVDAAARGLPQQARSADGAQLDILSAQFTGLHCIAEQLFGLDYAQLLIRSGQVAGLQNKPDLVPIAA
jgi:hypothetical protein